MTNSLTWAVLFAALGLSGCGAKSSGGENGGNTSWVKACDEAADCEDEDACISNVCLTPCGAKESCSGERTCGAVPELEASDDESCAANAGESFCTQACQRDADCEALGSGFACDQGACTPICKQAAVVGKKAGDECAPAVGCGSDDLVCVADSCKAEVGTCKALQGDGGCGEIYSPVCGCDGTTYDNPCSAGNAPIAHEGECERAPDVCNPTQGCGAPNQICDAESCDAEGVCREVGPVACDDIYDPVCGCDGVTYENACSARSTIDYEGACGDQEPEVGEPEPGQDTACVVYADVSKCCFEVLALSPEEAEKDECLLELVDGQVVQQPPAACLKDCGTDGGTCDFDTRAHFVATATEDGTCALEPACSDATCPGGPCDPIWGCDPSWECKSDECTSRLTCVAAACNEPGRCEVETASACDGDYTPVCGCDGTTHSNACEAGKAPIASDGECSDTQGANACTIALDLRDCCSRQLGATYAEIAEDPCLIEADPSRAVIPEDATSCWTLDCTVVTCVPDRPPAAPIVDASGACDLEEASCAFPGQFCRDTDCCDGAYCVDGTCQSEP